jgi:hypothetical protein
LKKLGGENVWNGRNSNRPSGGNRFHTNFNLNRTGCDACFMTLPFRNKKYIFLIIFLNFIVRTLRKSFKKITIPEFYIYH